MVFMQIIGLYAEVQLPTSTSLPPPVVDDSVQYSTPDVPSLTPAVDQSTEEAKGAVGESDGHVPEERSFHPLGEHHSTPFPSCGVSQCENLSTTLLTLPLTKLPVCLPQSIPLCF